MGATWASMRRMLQKITFSSVQSAESLNAKTAASKCGQILLDRRPRKRQRRLA